MKKVLYLTNLEVPYRARFFEMLSKELDLTVLFECQKTINRDNKWIDSQTSSYKKAYIGGFHTKGEHRFSLSVIKWIRQGWDLVIVGGYNSPVQAFAIICMRLMNIPFAINIDGESFIGNDFKSKIKKTFLRGATCYFAAGKRAAEELRQSVHPDIRLFTYNFSSLSQEELIKNAAAGNSCSKDCVLVVGAYFPYKGMDIALEAAKMDLSIHYKFVGMGKRAPLFLQEHPDLPANVEVIPFLQKDELYKAYSECRLCVLPSRQECWGLVVNEAASFGTPIVSTWGSGAAMEFLSEQYPQYLAKQGDAKSLYDSISSCIHSSQQDIQQYREYLKLKSKDYCLEKNVAVHVSALVGGQTR